MISLTAHGISNVIGGKLVSGPFDRVASGGVCTDSRHLPPHAVFFALGGENFDGNLFAPEASRTAAAVVVSRVEEGMDPSCAVILVEDTLEALQKLAAWWRSELTLTVFGLTGSNGKSATKDLSASVLSQGCRTIATQGNLNNHIGVPSTLLRLKAEHDLAVIEMGANHPGEIKFLSEIVEPDCGIITNVGKAHLEGFGSFEGVIKTKGELYDFLRKKEGSTVFIHHDNAYLMNIAEGLNLIPYGTEDNLYVNGRITGNSPYLTFEWKAGKDGKSYQVQTQLIGEYNFPNALAAITIGRFFGVEDAKINEALSGYTPQNNRSQLKKTDDNTLIIDAYNANPTSMMAALQNFRNMEVPHKMLILGDMRELGAESAAEHQKIADYLKECAFEKVWLVGDQFAAAEHSFQTYPNVQEVIKELEADKPKGYTILIKGSNGIKLSSVVDYL